MKVIALRRTIQTLAGDVMHQTLRLEQGAGVRNQTCDASSAFEAGRSLRLLTNDPDELARALLQWQVDIIQTRPGPLSTALLLAQGARVQLGYCLFNGAFRSRGAVPRDCATLVVADGDAPLISYGRVLESLDVEAMTAANGSDVSVLGRSNALVITVQRNLFESVALRVLGESIDRPLDQRRLRMIDAQRKRQVRYRLRGHLSAAMRSPSVLGQTNSRERWEHAVLSEVLNAVVPEAAPPPLPKRSRLAALAEDYMRANGFEPASVAELAAAVGTSERALHLGFLERFGLTPAAYLKMARLNGARRDLRSPSTGTLVTGTALRWGFFHLGRFAMNYRALFGEAPSDTLARSLGDLPD